MENIIIIGSSGHAKVVIDIVEKQGHYKIAGLLDRFRAVGEKTLDYPVLGREEDLPDLAVKYKVRGLLIAIGDNFVRGEVSTLVRSLCPDLPFVRAIHPNATIGRDVLIGEGTVVMGGVVISPCCSIGRFCILNTRASIAHDTLMADFSSIAPGVTIGGNCTIDKYAAICIGATLIHNVHIGTHTVIGAGATVLEDMAPFAVAYGSPASMVRKREAGDPYM